MVLILALSITINIYFMLERNYYKELIEEYKNMLERAKSGKY